MVDTLGMPFSETTRMDQRRALAVRVLEEGLPVARAALEFGVSRQTAHAWVRRAREEGLASMSERSRRPCSSPSRTEPSVESRLAELRRAHPYWGARKLLAVGWPCGAPLSERTANRVLARLGLLAEPRAAESPATLRFERALPNELWQLDLKGMGRGFRLYKPLSLLDDATRFCLALRPVSSGALERTWPPLWAAFGEYGLPMRLLSDNGDGFASPGAGPSRFEARLWLLGVGTSHGRPYHPQTQGKVERFHGTLQREMGAGLRQPDEASAARELALFRDRYNWERPHEALGMRRPGELYRASGRPRPARLPEHEIPECGWDKRKVDAAGLVCLAGERYYVGKGLAGEWVALPREHDGPRPVVLSGVAFANLADLRV